MRPFGDCLVMGYHENRDPLGVEPLKEREDISTAFGVEVTGRLVREDQFWIIHNRSSYRHSLSLATGELVGPMIHAIFKSYEVKRGDSSLSLLHIIQRSTVSHPIHEGHHHIPQRARPGEKMEALEDESHELVSQRGSLGIRESLHRLSL